MGLLDRIPPYISGLVPYPPGKPIDEVEREYGIEGSIKLASNECPIGPSRRATEAASRVLASLHRYPDGSGYYLKKKLSEKYRIEPANIILGNGSNEIIELIVRAFIQKDDEAVMGAPAFIVYELITQAVGGKAVPVALKDYRHDLAAMAEAITEKTRVVFVANPNNPTGTAVSGDDLAAFFRRVPEDVLIVMDEAYYEYAVCSREFVESLPWLKTMKNLVVLRTFSKAYGLAGLRVGYGIASPEIISMLERVRQPFNVNSIALAAAEAALDDEEHLLRGLAVNEAGMKFLAGALTALGLSFVESLANFILVHVGRDGSSLSTDLMKRGVIVRPVKGYGLPNHVRVTVGLPEENRRFMTVLKELLSTPGEAGK